MVIVLIVVVGSLLLSFLLHRKNNPLKDVNKKSNLSKIDFPGEDK